MSEDTETQDPLVPNPCAEEHPILLSLLIEALAEGDVFVDVGANTGYFAVPIAKTVGSTGRVHAFEPAADVAEQLRRAARMQGVEPWLTVKRLSVFGDPRRYPLAIRYIPSAIGRAPLLDQTCTLTVSGCAMRSTVLRSADTIQP